MMAKRTAEQWDARYREQDLPWDTRRAEPRLIELFERIQPPTQVAIDLGCGNGDNAMWLARQGMDTLGIDIAATAIATATARAREAGLNHLRFENTDILQKSLPVSAGTVGVVFDRGCFHSIDADDRTIYVKHVTQALAPGGWWLLICGNADEPRREGQTGPPQLTASELTAAVEPCFAIQHLERTNFTGHDGHPTHMAWRAMLQRR